MKAHVSIRGVWFEEPPAEVLSVYADGVVPWERVGFEGSHTFACDLTGTRIFPKKRLATLLRDSRQISMARRLIVRQVRRAWREGSLHVAGPHRDLRAGMTCVVCALACLLIGTPTLAVLGVDPNRAMVISMGAGIAVGALGYWIQSRRAQCVLIECTSEIITLELKGGGRISQSWTESAREGFVFKDARGHKVPVGGTGRVRMAIRVAREHLDINGEARDQAQYRNALVRCGIYSVLGGVAATFVASWLASQGHSVLQPSWLVGLTFAALFPLLLTIQFFGHQIMERGWGFWRKPRWRRESRQFWRGPA